MNAVANMTRLAAAERREDARHSSHPRCSLPVVALTLFAAACGGDPLPTAPSDLVAGVAIFQHANYRGESALLTDHVGHLGNFKGPCPKNGSSEDDGVADPSWDDCISSVKLAPGWRAILYRDPGYGDQRIDLVVDAPNLQLVPGTCSHDGLNDCISSIQIIPPR